MSSSPSPLQSSFFPSTPIPSAAPRSSISAPHHHTQSPVDHVPPPLQQYAPPMDSTQQPQRVQSQSRPHSHPAVLPLSSSDVPPPGQTPTTVAYRIKQASSAVADWLWRPFIQGLAFGLGTHLSLYTYQRYWLRQPPQLPFIANVNNTSSSNTHTEPAAGRSSTYTAKEPGAV